MPLFVNILDMNPVGYYADGSPRYSFTTSFPTRGVRVLKEGWADAHTAYAIGASAVDAWEARDRMGNMGHVLGVTKRDDGFHAVINLYHSNT
jgi:hypothetical protein